MQRNRLLNAMSNGDLALLQPHMQREPLRFRQSLQSSNRRIKSVYFVESGLASVVAMGQSERRQAEIAVVGHEGMTGLAVVLGAERSPCEVFMQVEGEGQCISADNLKAALTQSVSLLKLLLLFVHVFAVQSGYTALANAHGKIEERLARWLLMAQDRLDGDELPLTHEFLSLMLGVRRAGVSTALGAFEAKGLIRGSRGAITILDREGLEECANGLYGAPEAEYERVFAG